MRITVLSYVESIKDPADVVVKQVAQVLRKQGHKVSTLAIYDDLDMLVRGLRRRKPELIFNLMEMFGDDATADLAVAGVLELMGIPYTGSGPGELYITQDKVLGKKLLAFDGIQFPRFAVFSTSAAMETGGNLRLPLFVKPARMDASIGIGKKSLVRDTPSLMRRVVAIHDELKDAALAEEFIEGREFYVGVIGNDDPMALPPIELDFSGMPEGAVKVADAAAKWDEDSKEYKGTRSVIADVPDELRARLQKTAVDAYRALRVKDYGRVDMRVTDTGEIYVLEVNASCYLEKNSELAMSAKHAGIAFPDLVAKIVELALVRYGKRKRKRQTTSSSGT
jgi:D-alanine-D-alanine ligase